MKEPIFVRSLTDAERAALRSGLRSGQAFTLRRSQILLPGRKLSAAELVTRICDYY